MTVIASKQVNGDRLIQELFLGIVTVIIQLRELKCKAFQMVMLQESFRMINYEPTIIYYKMIGRFHLAKGI